MARGVHLFLTTAIKWSVLAVNRSLGQPVFACLISLGLVAAAAAADAPGNVVVHGASTARADEIAAFAERIRDEVFQRLLGIERPGRWAARCAIHVHATPDSFTDAVGSPPAGSRGATSIDFAGDAVASRRIDVMGDGPDVIPDALAHEIVHVALADHFVHAPPPRWADEGLAVLFDDSEKQGGHEEDFRAAAGQGVAFSTADLLALEDLPTGTRRQQVFYGQSAALVRWLINRRDAATLIRFIDDLETIGLEDAIERHYDLDSIASLESAWKEVNDVHSLSASSRAK
jgi:hypothetical protein